MPDNAATHRHYRNDSGGGNAALKLMVAATGTRPFCRIGASAHPVSSRIERIVIVRCGRVRLGKRKINLSQAFAGQNVGINKVSDRTWLVTFMHYDLGFFDHETCRLEPIADPFEPKLLPMSPI